MEWSLSKVMRIEKGQVNISPTDLRAVLQILEVTDEAEVEELLADARVSRNERYTTDEYDREYLTPAMIRLFQYETVATSVLHYNNMALPGFLQTREYAQTILRNWADILDDATITARLDVRLRRSSQVARRELGSEYRVILDESVLRRTIGGRSAMVAQLDHLSRALTNDHIKIRVCPLDADAPILFLGPFMLLDLSDPTSAILYRETPAGDEIVEAAEEISRHRAVFERLWPALPDEVESREMIISAAESLRNQNH
jgi:hypothetical protein